jgi:SNF2 family DNA or RNA helicase
MFFDPERNVIVYPRPELATMEGARSLNGHYVAFDATLSNLQRLHKAEIQIPAPLDYHYDWPGKHVPFEAQRVTSNFLVVNPHACVFNDTGTGKTSSALWAADYLMRLHESAGRRIRCLILAPVSCLDTVWANEIFKLFWSRRKTAICHGEAIRRARKLAEDVDFYVTNYEALTISGFAEALRVRDDIQIVVIDEASAYRAHTTARHKAARVLLGSREYLWLMTATPTSNGPTDAYGIAKLVNDAGGESYKSYRERVTFSVGPWKRVARVGAHEDARELMRPAVRFKIGDCIDLPPCTVQRREVELSAEQREAYKALVRDAQLMVRDGTIVNAANQAVLRGKLIQIVCGCVYDEHHNVHHLDCSPRLKVLREVIEDCAEKVIVFAPLTSVVEMLHARFKDETFCVVVNGATSVGERKIIFDRFQRSDSPRVIFADPGTMAHGLTLTAATTIVWYGPTDKTELYLQGNKRIDRPGQVKSTTIVQLASTPVEHEIYKRLQDNETILGAVLKLVEERRG